MNEDDINRLLFFTLDNIRKLGSPKISMWAMNDRYYSPPCLRFRFKDTPADDAIYQKLGDIIARFKGNLKWEMLHEPAKSANFFITSSPFAPFILKDRKNLLALMPRVDYENTIDKTIMDIPLLAEFYNPAIQRNRGIELNDLFINGRFSEQEGK